MIGFIELIEPYRTVIDLAIGAYIGMGIHMVKRCEPAIQRKLHETSLTPARAWIVRIVMALIWPYVYWIWLKRKLGDL